MVLSTSVSTSPIKPFVGVSSSWSVPHVETEHEVGGMEVNATRLLPFGSGNLGYGLEAGVSGAIGSGLDLMVSASYVGLAFTQGFKLAGTGGGAGFELDIDARYLELDAGIRWSPTPRFALASRVGYARFLSGEYDGDLFVGDETSSESFGSITGDLEEIWEDSEFPNLFDTHPQSFMTLCLEGEVVVWSGLSMNLGWVHGLGPMMEGGTLTSTVSRAVFGTRWTFGTPAHL